MQPVMLDNQLLLRNATIDDSERLAEFNGRVHAEDSDFDETIAHWTRDLLNGEHPTATYDDYWVIEDTKNSAIASTLCLIPQTWSYEGISFGVGRPELVATHKDYRRRGLVRMLFDVLHRRSTELGHLVQGITGISYFYRQFGYEYALDLGGGRGLYWPSVPEPKLDEKEPYELRPLAVDDIGACMEMDRHFYTFSLMRCQRDESLWRYELQDMHPKSCNARRGHAIVARGSGQMVGYVAPSPVLWGKNLGIVELVLASGASLQHVLPSLLRGLQNVAEEMGDAEGKHVNGLFFSLGRYHPVYKVLDPMQPRVRPPYAWYIRVADLAAFVQRIGPALEQRLAASVAVGYSGELRIGFYRDGLSLRFEDGRLVEIKALPADVEKATAMFPPLVFKQLLFCYRSLAELRHAFPDVWASEEGTVLLDALFPTRPSCFAPVS